MRITRRTVERIGVVAVSLLPLFVLLWFSRGIEDDETFRLAIAYWALGGLGEVWRWTE